MAKRIVHVLVLSAFFLFWSPRERAIERVCSPRRRPDRIHWVSGVRTGESRYSTSVRTPVAHRRNRNGTAHPTAVSLPRAHWRWVASRLSAVGQRHVPVHYYDGRVTNNQSFSARRSAGRTASRPVFISCRPDAELVTDEYNRGRPCASGA